MSHFAVLVATREPGEDNIAECLQPFHEYECTGIRDSHVVFVDETDDVKHGWENDTLERFKDSNGEIHSGYDDIFYRDPTEEELEKMGGMTIGSGWRGNINFKSKDWDGDGNYRPKVHHTPWEYTKVTVTMPELYDSMEQYAEDYHGYSVHPDGCIGRYTNPNAKWDWWVIGGRWDGYLLHKDGRHVNCLQKKDLELEKPMQVAAQKAADRYDKAMKVLDGKTWKSWEETRTEFENKDEKLDFDKIRDTYHGQEAVKLLHKHIKEEKQFFFNADVFLGERSRYIERCANNTVGTFALLHLGEWKEEGSMGWWGCVADEDDEWDQKFHKMLATIPDDYYLTVVDCHI